MTPERWQQIERVYHAAVAREERERAAFLAEACAGDDTLRQEVESLLAQDANVSRFLETPVAQVAQSLSDGSLLGHQLGPYALTTLLGVGGMGEVYKATDTRLDRVVAVKVLSDHISGSPHAQARFEREAKAISNLNHPNICTLHDVGQDKGIDFLVMEYVEGETLAERLTKGPLPLDQVLRCAIQIADALDKAHRQGVVHRDLKPGNIMLTRSGTARPGATQIKLLDFGLAKTPMTTVPSGSAAGARTRPLTGHGTILGTLNYMAPEQAEGRDADPRSDIFAFGAVLYEMATGHRAFEGDSAADVMAAILTRDPPALATVQPLTPPALDRLVATCLAKDLDERWQNAGDLARELAWIEQDVTKPGERATAAGVPALGWVRFTWNAAGPIAGIVIGAAATGLLVPSLTTGPGGQARDVARVLVGITPADRLRAATDTPRDLGHVSRSAIALTPNGRTLVFSADRGDRQELYTRTLDQLDAVPMPGTDGATNPFLSPDGQWVGFWANGALKKVPLSGGAPTTLCETPAVFGASWGSNDVILFAQETGGLWQVSAMGGPPVAVTTVDEKAGEVSHRLPQILPGNQAVIFTVTRTLLPTWEDTLIVAQSMATGSRKVLIEGGADARYVPTGHLVYMRRSTLMAVPFDPRDLKVSGGPVAVLSDVMQAANMINAAQDSGAGQFSIASSGSLAYIPGSIYSLPDRSLVWVDQSGRLEALAAPRRAYTYPRLSPDGARVLVSSQGDRNIWIYDVTRGTSTRLTTEGRSQAAIWTPDGTRVTYGSSTTGTENLFWTPADGTATPERLTTSPLFHRASAWSPDGQVLAFVAMHRGPDHYGILTLSRVGNREPTALTGSRVNETHPEFSPDGRWLAYSSDESGRYEIYVRPYPGPGARVLVSTDGGTAPAWAKDGQQLFYLAPATAGKAGVRMMAVSVTLGTQLTAGRPRALFESATLTPGTSIRNFDVTSDGRFLAVQTHERSLIRPAQIVLVQNWTEELKRLVPTK